MLVVVLAACSSGGGASAPTPSARPTPISTDRPGGTLHIAGTSDVSGDPGWATTSAERLLVRMTSRQLYAYPAAPAPAAPGTTPTPSATPSAGSATSQQPGAVPDLAAGQPVGTDGGRTWTVQLRADVRWDVQPSDRQVTATDVARGLKRLCLPPTPSPFAAWYTTTIQGYAQYCAALSQIRTQAKQIQFLESKQVTGIQIVGNTTLKFHLIRPANDITALLALPAASAVPAEELNAAPNSAAYRAGLISDGPYAPSAPMPGESARLSRNPAWNGGGDAVRKAYVDHVSFTFGLTAAQVQAALAAGRADMSWDTEVPAAAAAKLAAAKDPRFGGDGAPDLVVLAFGLHGPSGTVGTVAVRQALAECVDRTAVTKALGTLAAPATRFAPVGLTEGSSGPDTTAPSAGAPSAVPGPTPTGTGTADPNSSTGSSSSASSSAASSAGVSTASPASPSPSVSPGSEPTPRQPLSLTADPTACRRNLAAALTAAHLKRRTLTLLARNDAQDLAVAAALKRSFAAGGVTLSVKVVSAAQYALQAAAPLRQTWDLTAARVSVEWWGSGSRAVLQPLVDSRWLGTRPVDGGYRSPAVDAALDAALAEQSSALVPGRWATVETDVLNDGALQPLATVGTPRYHGKNVRGWVPVPSLGSGDPTTVSLAAT